MLVRYAGTRAMEVLDCSIPVLRSVGGRMCLGTTSGMAKWSSEHRH